MKDLDHAHGADLRLDASPNARRLTNLPLRTIAAVVLGNALEFYDFTIYTAFAPILGRTFFPAQDPMTSLILSVSTFGIGFFVRPLGAVLLGAYSDRYGRKSAMTVTIGLMAFASGMIGLLPSYAQIGIAAPILLAVGRLIQGFSVGGELAPSTVFLMETAPVGRECFFGSFQFAGQGLAGIMSGVVGLLLAMLLPKTAVEQGGWRVAFLIGILIAPFGIYIRRRLRETLSPDRPHVSMSSILSTVLRREWQLTTLGVLVISGVTVTQYFFLYAAAYATAMLHYSQQVAVTINFAVGVVGMVFILMGGVLTDKLGVTRLAFALRLALALLVYPALSIASPGGSPTVLLAVIVGLTALHAVGGAAPVFLVLNAFPAAVRSTGFSISMALATTLFGGTAQIVFTWIIASTGDRLSFVYYIVGMNLVTVAASLLTLRHLNSRRSPASVLPAEAESG
ncbi:MFS transporter [Bradyrhizobium sp. BRP22]|uniref:MFS transporter n=1 Tax=Bradyrhizobium sp. BRP22 TaxID=2793821 RepID=UPI001CD7DB8F|nr:MFS transporter [Bradyrhizobium sp. BRP22]MCA1455930.1 MFS transporter [Bradyrhizobium sp. BRP22]